MVAKLVTTLESVRRDPRGRGGYPCRCYGQAPAGFPAGEQGRANQLSGKSRSQHPFRQSRSDGLADQGADGSPANQGQQQEGGGVGEGMQLSMSSKGNEMPGGIPGDLLIVIEEAEDGIFQREGNNVIYDLHISFIEAALGESVEVPTLDGKVKIKIDPGTQSGKMLRLKGKGIKDINGYGRGDQLIMVNIWTPTTLSKEERTVLEGLKNSENFKPDPGKQEKSFFDRMKEFF